MRDEEIAANLLWTHWMVGTRLTALPADVRPATRAEGYRIQAVLETHSKAPLLGWKFAATNAAGQAQIGGSAPLAGRLLAERVIPDDGICPYGANHLQVAEIEFASRMGESLPPRAAPCRLDEVLAAVATLHPAIEISDLRYENCDQVGAPQLLADNACASYFVVGSAAPPSWRDLDLAHHVISGWVNDTPYAGIGGNVLGDPREAQTWLANEFSQLGIALLAGQVVTTGTCVVPMTIAPRDRVRGDLGILEIVSVSMGA